MRRLVASIAVVAISGDEKTIAVKLSHYNLSSPPKDVHIHAVKIELLGPEYSLELNTLSTGLKVFLSRDHIRPTAFRY